MKTMRISFAKMFLEIGEVLNSMFSGVWPGVLWLLTFVLGLIAPAWPPFAAVCILVVIDMRTGRQAARHRGEEINSKGMRRSVGKIASYFYLIAASFIMDEIFLKGLPISQPTLYLASLLCAAIEFKSISENVQTVTGVNLWSRIKDRILPDTKKNTGE
jgi:phage-related holin